MLPRQNEIFSEGEIAANIMYVGNSTRRREQIQFNWSIETQPVAESQSEPEPEPEPEQGSPRRSPRRPRRNDSAAAVDAAAKPKPIRRSPRRHDAALFDSTDDSATLSENDSADSDYSGSADRSRRGRRQRMRKQKRLDFKDSSGEFDTPEVLTRRVGILMGCLDRVSWWGVLVRCLDGVS